MCALKWATHADLAIRRSATVGRQEYLDHMTFRRNERPLFTEIFGPIVGLKEEWVAQGATPGELDFPFATGARRAAPYPSRPAGTAGCRRRSWKRPPRTGSRGTPWGRTMKLAKGRASLPLPLDFPVRTMDDWLRIKPWYQFDPSRLSGDWRATAHRHRQADQIVCVDIPGGFDEPRQLLGEEALCLGYYEQPELIHDMLQTVSDTAFAVLERVTAEVPVD